ncbi:hypothetical protein [Micromonospora sp. 067-2]|uniref:hypothetical protein n=1 Tax=Micromonospora sp. 067-2 TaxID=2789270 RepID=UPI00397DA34B
MAFRTWGRLLLTALGVSVLAGAGQLGVAYGFGIVRLTGAFTGTTVNQWPAQLVWVGWFAANAAVVGAVLTGRLARRDGLPGSTGRQLAVAAAAALGATAVAPLCMQPARAAELISVDPVWAVGICAVLGAVIGAGAAIAVLLRPELGWNVAALAGIVWAVALISVLPSLGAAGALPTVRLGVLEPGWLDDGAAQRLGLVLLPIAALLAGAATAALARSRGQVPLVSGATGVAGPVLVAFAYLTAGPGDAVDRYQTTPYYGALIAVLAGALGATAAALSRWPARPRTADTQAIAPTTILRSLPAGPALPGAESAPASDDREHTEPTMSGRTGAGLAPSGDTGTVRTVPAHWDWPAATASGQYGPAPVERTGPEGTTDVRPADLLRHRTGALLDPARSDAVDEPNTDRVSLGESVQDDPAEGRSPRRAGGRTPTAPAAWLTAPTGQFAAGRPEDTPSRDADARTSPAVESDSVVAASADTDRGRDAAPAGTEPVPGTSAATSPSELAPVATAAADRTSATTEAAGQTGDDDGTASTAATASSGTDRPTSATTSSTKSTTATTSSTASTSATNSSTGTTSADSTSTGTTDALAPKPRRPRKPKSTPAATTSDVAAATASTDAGAADDVTGTDVGDVNGTSSDGTPDPTVEAPRSPAPRVARPAPSGSARSAATTAPATGAPATATPSPATATGPATPTAGPAAAATPATGPAAAATNPAPATATTGSATSATSPAAAATSPAAAATGAAAAAPAAPPTARGSRKATRQDRSSDGAGSDTASVVARPGKGTRGTASDQSTTAAIPAAAVGPVEAPASAGRADPAVASTPTGTADQAAGSAVARTADTERATDTDMSSAGGGSVVPLFGPAAGNPEVDRWTPAPPAWPNTPARKAPQVNDSGSSTPDAPVGPEDPTEWTPRPRHRAPLPDLSRVSSWDAFTTARTAGSADRQDSSAADSLSASPGSTEAIDSATPADWANPTGTSTPADPHGTSEGQAADPRQRSAGTSDRTAAGWRRPAGTPERRLGAASSDPVLPAAPANPTPAFPVVPERAGAPSAADNDAVGPASADVRPAARTENAEQPSRRGRLGGLFRRNRTRAEEESRAASDTPEPLPAKDEEFVDWVAGLSKPITENDPEQENERRSLRSTGRHHRD